MILLKDVGLVILSGLVAYFIGSTALGFQFYTLFFPEEKLGSGFFGAAIGEAILGMIVAYSFLLPLLLASFGSKFKIWWVGIFLIPVVWIVASTDLLRIWFYFFVAFAGWGIGFGIAKLLALRTKGS